VAVKDVRDVRVHLHRFQHLLDVVAEREGLVLLPERRRLEREQVYFVPFFYEGDRHLVYADAAVAAHHDDLHQNPS
jgi:hypothetical protein